MTAVYGDSQLVRDETESTWRSPQAFQNDSSEPQSPVGWYSFTTIEQMIKAYQTRKLAPCQQKAKVYDECV